MKKFKLLLTSALCLSALSFSIALSTGKVYAAEVSSDDFSKLASALNYTKSNDTTDIGLQDEIFDSSNPEFRSLINATKKSDGYTNSFISKSITEFSSRFTDEFSIDAKANVDLKYVTADVNGKFKIDKDVEKIENREDYFEYWYNYQQTRIVNIDWRNPKVKNLLSPKFKRDLDMVDTLDKAIDLIDNYGTHVFEQYALGGRLEITKFTSKKQNYEVNDQRLNTSVDAIVKTANSTAEAQGKFNSSEYERELDSNKNYYSKMSMNHKGGIDFDAMTVDHLFTYNPALANGNGGYVYKAWLQSFKDINNSQEIVKAKGSIPIWELLDNEYINQKNLLQKAYDIISFKNYSELTKKYKLNANYIENVIYNEKDQEIKLSINENNELTIPDGKTASVNISNNIINTFKKENLTINVNSQYAQIEDNKLIINPSTSGNTFDMVINAYDKPIYVIKVNIADSLFSGGLGTKENPYLISNKSEFDSIYSKANAHFKLINDIDLKGLMLSSGGQSKATSFTGVFDGDGYKIKNASIISGNVDNYWHTIGLFGKNNGIIKNLTIDTIKAYINGTVKVKSGFTLNSGVLIGENYGQIDNCIINNSVLRVTTECEKNAYSNVGFIAGYSNGKISNCLVENSNMFVANVDGKGTTYNGLLVGQMENSEITNCYTRFNKLNSYYLHKNHGYAYVSNLVGRIMKTRNDNTNLSYCVEYKNIIKTSESIIGYIAGECSGRYIQNCYFDEDVDKAVNGKHKDGCINIKNITVAKIGNHVMSNNWVDTDNGPMLKIHLKGGN